MAPRGPQQVDPFLDKLERPRNNVQWLLFNSQVMHRREAQPMEIDRQKYRIQFEDYYSKCVARNSNAQIHYDLQRVGILPPAYTEHMLTQPRIDEVQFTINML